MSDDAVKRLRDDLTNKAMLYLEQVCVLRTLIFTINTNNICLLKERTQKNKAEQENLEALETDLHKVEQQLQDHMITSVSKGDQICDTPAKKSTLLTHNHSRAHFETLHA